MRKLVPMTVAVAGTLIVAMSTNVAAGPPGQGGKGSFWNQGSKGSGPMHMRVFAGRGRLGVAVLEVSEGVRKALGGPSDHGVLINEVQPGSAADKAGVEAGDLVVTVDGEKVRSAMEIVSAMADKKKGGKVAVEVIRHGKTKSLTAEMTDDAVAFHMDKDFHFDFDPGQGNWSRVMPFGPGGMGGGDAQKKLDELEKKLEQMQRQLDKMNKSPR